MPPVTRAEEFKDEAEKMGLKKETVAKMVDQDIDSLAVVVLLREGDIAAISLTVGQMLLLTRWVVTLHGTEPTPSESVSGKETPGLQDQSPRSVAGKALFRCVSDSRGTDTNSRHISTTSTS